MNRILIGDSLKVLKTIPDCLVHCCVTSPPYYGLRDYGVKGQIGLEETPQEYIQNLVAVFREVKRLLRDDGTLWVNIGDSYAGSGKGGQPETKRSKNWQPVYPKHEEKYGLKAKDLIGIPWLLAFALRADGWYLRQDIIWHKPNPMPESVTDRCTKSHEYIFLLSKSARYYFNHSAIKEPSVTFNTSIRDRETSRLNSTPGRSKIRGLVKNDYIDRNKRDVWTVNTEAYSDAHFAVFPEKLILPCVLAGCPENGVVLDPFMGSGTTAVVAVKTQRNYIGCEINSDYVKISEKRIAEETGLFSFSEKPRGCSK